MARVISHGANQEGLILEATSFDFSAIRRQASSKPKLQVSVSDFPSKASSQVPISFTHPPLCVLSRTWLSKRDICSSYLLVKEWQGSYAYKSNDYLALIIYKQ
jgi:hypothetical protein